VNAAAAGGPVALGTARHPGAQPFDVRCSMFDVFPPFSVHFWLGANGRDARATMTAPMHRARGGDAPAVGKGAALHSTPAEAIVKLRGNFLRGTKMSHAAKLLRELIALPSVNPAFLPSGDPRAGEQRVADFLAAITARAGLDVEVQEVFPHRANLLARLAPRGKTRQRILLAPHLDT